VGATPVILGSPGKSWRLPISPVLVFLQRCLPSSPAHVMQLSCISVGRAFTDFRFNQDLQAFPPASRFPLAHIT